MHLRCRNCAHTSHVSNFMDGNRCVRCRGRAEAVVPAQVVTVGAEAPAAPAAPAAPSSTPAALPPETKLQSSVTETVASGISDLTKVGLIVGGAVLVVFVYNMIKIGRKTTDMTTQVAGEFGSSLAKNPALFL